MRQLYAGFVLGGRFLKLHKAKIVRAVRLNFTTGVLFCCSGHTVEGEAKSEYALVGFEKQNSLVGWSGVV